MKKIISILSFCLLLLFYYSCSKSNETTQQNPPPGNNPPPGTCDTVNMQYAAHIAPLIQTNCFSCHSTANMAISGISLEGYANLKARVDDGRLLGAITHAAGFSPMPKDMAKLSDCNINRIRGWINRGAPNN